MTLKFANRIYELEEERVIATLWGCIQRRRAQMNDLATIRYNEEFVLVSHQPHLRGGAPSIVRTKSGIWGDIQQGELLMKTEDKKGTQQVQVSILEIDEESLQKEKRFFHLLPYAFIPLKKRQEKEKIQSIQSLESLQLKSKSTGDIEDITAFRCFTSDEAIFTIRRDPLNEREDYATWPLVAMYTQNKERSPYCYGDLQTNFIQEAVLLRFRKAQKPTILENSDESSNNGKAGLENSDESSNNGKAGLENSDESSNAGNDRIEGEVVQTFTLRVGAIRGRFGLSTDE